MEQGSGRSGPPGTAGPAEDAASVSASSGSGALGLGSIDSARGSLVLLLGLNLLTYLDRQVLAAVESRIQLDILPDDPNAQAKMGLLATMFLVSYMVFSPAFGVLGDRMSRWVLVSVGTVLGALATGWTGVAASFAGLFLARCMVGVAEAAYAPVAPTLLSDLYPVKDRGKILAWFYAAIPVGSALGYAYGGLVADFFHWRWAFLGLVVPGIVLGLVPLWFKDPRPTPSRATRAGAGETGGAEGTGGAKATGGTGAGPVPLAQRLRTYGRLFRIPSYALCCGGMTAMTFAMGGISFWMPRYIHVTREHGTLGGVTLTLGVIVVITGLAATLGGGWLGDKLRDRYGGSYFLVSGGGLLAGFPLFLLVLLLPFPWAWIPLAGAVFCLFFNTGPSNTIIANVTEPPVRSTAFALNIFIIHALGDAISPPLIGYMADRVGLGLAIGVVGVMFLVGGVLWLMGARYLARDTERVERNYPHSRSQGVPIPV